MSAAPTCVNISLPYHGTTCRTRPKRKPCGAPTWRLPIRSILIHKSLLFSVLRVTSFSCAAYTVGIYFVHHDFLQPGVDVKTFAEASLLLTQPPEDFFNNIFIMAVMLCASFSSPQLLAGIGVLEFIHTRGSGKELERRRGEGEEKNVTLV